MKKTRIEWCDSSWNPITGCRNDCAYCYARRMAGRFSGNIRQNIVQYRLSQNLSSQVHDYELDKPFTSGSQQSIAYPFGFSPTLHKYRLDLPSMQKNGANVFVGSMCDMFGDWVPDEWIEEVFNACEAAPQHNYMFLTKNPEGIETAIDNYACEDRGSNDCFEFFSNFWFGATVTGKDDLSRIGTLSNIEEGHRFLSIEPIHGPVYLYFKKERCPVCDSLDIYRENPKTSHGKPVYCDSCGEWSANNDSELKPSVNWVIIGCETGNRKGKVVPKAEWIAEIVFACDEAGVPVFMKDSLVPVVGEANMRREFPDGLKKAVPDA